MWAHNGRAVLSVLPNAGYRVGGRDLTPAALAGIGLAVALLLVLPRPLWRWSRLGVTAVHESGHAIAALLVGRKVTAIRLRPDSSGLTVHYGPGGTLRRLITAFGGYPAPGLVGLAGALLVSHRDARIWLLALVALGLVNVVLWIRNPFGFLVMAGWLGAVGWLVVRGRAGVDALVSAAAVWYLVLGGLRAAFEVPPPPAKSDAQDVGRLLHLPTRLCKAGFVIAAAASVVVTARVLFLASR